MHLLSLLLQLILQDLNLVLFFLKLFIHSLTHFLFLLFYRQLFLLLNGWRLHLLFKPQLLFFFLPLVHQSNLFFLRQVSSQLHNDVFEGLYLAFLDV
mmetsp:Transcript_28516/g.27490  ORF Transcript_28516/g.27490 Transcript_28516/m.27490 type:complete len:97 (-) Transcript_28516:817-1107(-)